MRFHNKRTLAVAAVLTLALGGGVAYAYWTTTGSGTATATVGTDGPFAVAQVGTVTGLYPAGPAQGVSFTVTNPNASAELLSNATLAVTGTSAGAACDASNFVVVDPVFAPVSIAGSGGSTTVNGATIAMIDTGVNQNACKGATVNLSIDVS